MKVEFYEDINEFIDLAFPFLLKNEAENNLAFMILNSLKENLHRYGDYKPHLITVSENDEIKLISFRTPPYNQFISYTDILITVDLLIEELIKKNAILPGVLGFKKGAERFAKLWCMRNGLKPQLVRNERGHKLIQIAEETIGNRTFIIGTEANQSIILKWAEEMVLEAGLMTEAGQMERTLNQIKQDIIDQKMFLLLDNDEPVSMARNAGKTPNGNLINFVYTPPHLRRNGYATECVAKLSKQLLDGGNKFCFLFTDLANPISNSIYQKIGYRPVIDLDEYKFL
ncbi:MAG: GNAT family N-acetyltransferase [Promethearchaeota archaeon]